MIVFHGDDSQMQTGFTGSSYGAANVEIKVPSVENPELSKVSLHSLEWFRK